MYQVGVQPAKSLLGGLYVEIWTGLRGESMKLCVPIDTDVSRLWLAIIRLSKVALLATLCTS